MQAPTVENFRKKSPKKEYFNFALTDSWRIFRYVVLDDIWEWLIMNLYVYDHSH
jgi:hypothetical protein